MLMNWHYANEGIKGRLEAWKRAFESKRLRVNVMKIKIMIRSENDGNVAEEGKFLCVVSSV